MWVVARCCEIVISLDEEDAAAADDVDDVEVAGGGQVVLVSAEREGADIDVVVFSESMDDGDL